MGGLREKSLPSESAPSPRRGLSLNTRGVPPCRLSFQAGCREFESRLPLSAPNPSCVAGSPQRSRRDEGPGLELVAGVTEGIALGVREDFGRRHPEHMARGASIVEAAVSNHEAPPPIPLGPPGCSEVL